MKNIKSQKFKPSNYFKKGFSLKLSFFFASIIITVALNGQTPGPFYQSLTPPASFSNSISLTPSSLGIGRVLAPDGWQELRYCQQNYSPLEKGLIITRENCNPNGIGIGPISNDFIYNSDIIDGGTGGGGNTLPELSLVPIPIALGTIPFSYYSPLNTTGPNSPSPTLNLRSGQQPMFQVRTVDYPSSISSNSSGSVKSRFIVMPDGNSGINTEDPRAALDVQDANSYNTPVAIFGNVLPFSATNLPLRTNAGGAPIKQTFTRHIAIVPRLKDYGFNMISHNEDIGLIFTNGLGVDGSNTNGALVIAPYTQDKNVGGLRIESTGNAELRGNLRCNKLTVNTKWWPDAVFMPNYQLMSLCQVDSFIRINRHLPGMPCEDSVIIDGQNVGDLQVLQQQKIEELTLYLIHQEKQQKLQEILISEQKNLLVTQEMRLQKLEALLKQK
jgi:hypothetical protein